MLQEGVPRRVLCWRLEGLELLLLFSRASVPPLPSIYCVPLPQAAPPHLLGDQKALPVLVSSVMQNLVGSVGRVRSVSKPVSPPRGLPAVTQLQFFPFKEQREEQTRSPWLCCWTEGPDDYHLLAPLNPPRLPPSAPPSRRDGCFSGPGVGALMACCEGDSRPDAGVGSPGWFALEWLILACFGVSFGACQRCEAVYLVQGIPLCRKRNLIFELK